MVSNETSVECVTIMHVALFNSLAPPVPISYAALSLADQLLADSPMYADHSSFMLKLEFERWSHTSMQAYRAKAIATKVDHSWP